MVSLSQEPRSVLGLRIDLVWGLAGVLFFIVGDGLEQAWISPYLIERGMTMSQSATLISLYGIAVAIGAWLSGVFVEAWGVRVTMLAGAGAWLLGQILFLLIALPTMSFAILIPTYCVRGFGYPLFCYSFLVWVTYKNPKETLGTAVGWFYMAFTGGLYIVSNAYASWMIPLIGREGVLWSAIIWVVLGTGIVLVFVKSTPREKASFKEQFVILLGGITIMKANPPIAIGGIVRMINGASQFALPVFYPVFLCQFGFPTEAWLKIWAAAFSVNIIFNLIWGVVGDRIGWRKTIQIFGGFGCGCAMLLMASGPSWFAGNFTMMLVMSGIYGAFLAGFCPISALIPSLEPDHKGAAMSVLSLGAGMASFAGPAIVALSFTFIGAKGVLYVFACLYFISIPLAGLLREKRG